MTETEFKQIQEMCGTVSIDQLMDKSPRTLLWGYTAEKQSWHVFTDYGMIHLYVYDGEKRIYNECNDSWVAQSLVPNKRLYPEACDFEFCRLLTQAGVLLPFTKYNTKRPYQQYHGKLP